MADPDDLDRLADKEAGYARLSRRANQRMTRILVSSFGTSAAVAGYLALRARVPLALVVPSLAFSLGGGVAAAVILRRTAPDTLSPASALGLRRAQRWQIYRAMWHRLPLTDPAQLPIIEELASKLRRGLPIVIVSFAFLTLMGPIAILVFHIRVFPRWLAWTELAALPLLLVQQGFMARRSAHVAELTRNLHRQP